MKTGFNKRLYLLTYVVWDVFLAASALVFAVSCTRHACTFSSGATWLILDQPLFLVFALSAFHISGLQFRLYESRRLDSGRGEVAAVTKAGVTTTGAVSASSILLAPELANATFLIQFSAHLLLTTIASRIITRLVLRRIRERGHDLRSVIIAGSGRMASDLTNKLRNDSELGYRIVGYIDDDDKGALCPTVPHLGRLETLPAILSRTVVDEVFVALPIRSQYSQIRAIMLACEVQGVAVTLTPGLFSMRLLQTKPALVGNSTAIRFCHGPAFNPLSPAKRYVDFALAAVATALLLPLLLLIALLIKATSPGPVLFRQVRIGLNKRPFTIYKFRTMTVDAEKLQPELERLNEATGAVFKIRKDPRVTRVGRFLREFSLDELPQLLNVLKGEMSLVGPRPLPLRDVALFQEDAHRRRFSVLPGITCLWQLGGRSDLSFDQWMALDLEYIDSWSLGLDLQIIAQTAIAVVRRTGAY